MKKILYLIPTLQIGGSEKHLYHLVKGLDKDKFNVYVCSMTDIGSVGEGIKNLSIEVFALQMKNFYDVKKLYKLYNFLKEKNIDILYAYLFDANFWGPIIAKIAGVKRIISSRRGIAATWYKKRHIISLKFANLFVNKFVANSKAIKCSTVKVEKIKEDKIVVIYNGVEIQREDVRIQSSELKEQLNIPPNYKVITNVSNLYPHKGQKYFLQAILEIKKHFQNIKYLLVGDGVERNYLENLTKELNIEEDVIFAGRRKDVFDILSISNISCQSSLTEGLSNVVLESFACKVPTIATDVGGNSEVIENYKNGILIPSKNPEAISEAVLYLLRNEDKAKEMAAEGYETVKNKFSIEKMIENYSNLYEEIK